MTSRFVAKRADWVGVLEAAYASAPSDAAWANAVHGALRGVFEGCDEHGLHVIEHSADCSEIKNLVLATQRTELDGIVSDGFAALGPTGVRAYYYPKHTVNTIRSIQRTVEPHAREYVGQLLNGAGFADCVGILFHPAPGVAGVVWARVDGPASVSHHERRLLSQVAVHLETAYRLRRRPETIRAVLRPDGRVEHREGGELDTARLKAHLLQVESARTKRRRVGEQGLDLWRALVGGEVSVVERTDGAQRHYLVVENPPHRQPMRVLTDGELDAVALAARGMSAKLIAYSLGISAVTVSARLAAAASKVGVATRIELIRLAAMLTREPRAAFDDLSLTDAERNVLELVRSGLSNDEIAQMRSRSVRTIANQVATLLKKTNATSRRALVAR